MKILKIEMSEAEFTAYVDWLCMQWNYQDNIVDPTDPTNLIVNPETKPQFAKKIFLHLCSSGFRKYKEQQYLDGLSTPIDAEFIATQETI